MYVCERSTSRTPPTPLPSPFCARVRCHLHSEPRQVQSGQQQTERRAPPSKGRASRQGTDVSRQTCTHTKQNKMMQCAHVRAFQQTTFFALDPSFSLLPRPTTLGGACFFLCIYMLEYKQLHVYHNVGNCHIILDTLVLQALFNP